MHRDTLTSGWLLSVRRYLRQRCVAVPLRRHDTGGEQSMAIVSSIRRRRDQLFATGRALRRRAPWCKSYTAQPSTVGATIASRVRSSVKGTPSTRLTIAATGARVYALDSSATLGPTHGIASSRMSSSWSQLIRQANPGAKLVLFGHSLGSFIAQDYITHHAGLDRCTHFERHGVPSAAATTGLIAALDVAAKAAPLGPSDFWPICSRISTSRSATNPGSIG